MHRTTLSSTMLALAAGLVLAACNQAPTAPQPITAVQTFDDVYGLDVIDGAVDSYSSDLNAFLYGETDVPPDGVPASYDGIFVEIDCEDGLYETQTVAWAEGEFANIALGDAWDGADLGLFAVDVDSVLSEANGVGTVYDDGTVVLACTAPVTRGDLVATVTRYVVVAGAGDGLRFAFDVIVVRNDAGDFDLSEIYYDQGTGADESQELWEVYGTAAPFEWATAGNTDPTELAMGIVSFVPVGMVVDAYDDLYSIVGDAGTLASGETIAFGFLGAVEDRATTKDAAMQALGAELDAFDGGAICEPAASRDAVFAWLDVVEDGEAILESICAGYEAL